MRKFFITTAALAAAVLLFGLVTLPPAPASTPPPFDPDLQARTIPGAYHVHSTVSDGTDSREAIAAAAAEAGLRFVIFTEHGDGTRRPDPPRYLNGVLCVDGVEISTDGGHYVALDMRPAPFPLGGEPATVVEDVRRLGGFGIAAHPESEKAELGWRDWSVPIDGLEWLNADSEWRDETRTTIARVPLYYLFRPGPALATLLDRPVTMLNRWDTLTAVRPAVGLAAHDAHGGFLLGADRDRRPHVSGVPSYEASFKTFALRAVLPSPLSGAPAADGRMLLDAVRRGRLFTVIDSVAAPALLDFQASQGDTRATMGDAMLFEPDVDLSVRTNLPPGGRLRMLCGGRAIAETDGDRLAVKVPGPGACRAEIVLPGAPGNPPVPWLITNPIYFLPAVAEPVGSEPLIEIAQTFDNTDWLLEKDTRSSGTVQRQGVGFSLTYQLGAGERSNQYVAVVTALRGPLVDFERLILTASSLGPMRVSIQFRFEGGDRWGRSVYVEPDPRRISLAVADLVPIDASGSRPDFRQASSLIFMVDLTNAIPGSTGRLDITDVALGRPVLPGR